MSKRKKSQTFSSFGELAEQMQAQQNLRREDERRAALERAVTLAREGRAFEGAKLLDDHNVVGKPPANAYACGWCYAEAAKQNIAEDNLERARVLLRKAVGLGYAPWHVQQRLDLISRALTGKLDRTLPEDWASRFDLACPNCTQAEPSPLTCAKCRGVLREPSSPIYQQAVSELHALGVYRWQGDLESFNTLSRAIRWLKGNEGEAICKYLAYLLVDELYKETDFLGRADVIVPVPADPARQRSRGFDNIAALAVEMEAFSLVPSVGGVLRKVRSTEDLRHLPWHERPLALEGALQVVDHRAAHVREAVVLLADDVTTSGTTLDACASVLLEAGAEQVLAATLAKSESSS